MKRFLIALATLTLLAACAEVPLQSPATGTTNRPNTANPTEMTAGFPSIVIKNRQARAIFDDIVQYRKQKGMVLKRRTAQRLEFSIPVLNATKTTEARMSYFIAPVEGGWLLSARVWQITAPGTSRESASEITTAVADKIHEELQTYERSKP